MKPILNQLRYLIRVPGTWRNEQQQRRAETLHLTFLFICFGSLLYLFGSPSIIAGQSRFVALTILCGIMGDLLLRFGYLRISSVMSVSILWLVFTAGSFTEGGLTSGSFAGNISIVIFAGLVLGLRGAITAAVASILAGGLSVYLSANNLMPVPAITYSQMNLFADFTIYIVITALFTGITINRIDKSTIAFERELEERKRAEVAAQESERRLRTLIRQAPVGITLTRDGMMLDANPAYLSMFGYESVEELQGGSLLNQIAPQCRDEIAGRIERRMAGQEVEATYESVGLRKDGSQFPFLVSATRIVLSDGPLTISFFTDFTERKQVDDALRSSEERFRLIAENTADSITVLDLALKLTYVSPSVLQLRGYTAEEAMSQTLEQILTPASYKRVQAVLTEQLILEEVNGPDPSRTALLELEEYCKDGSTVWVELSGSFLRDSALKPTAILTITRDITKRKKAEEELQRSEAERSELLALMRSMSDTMPDMLWAKDTNGRYIFANRAICEKLLNAVDTSEPIGKTDLFFARRERESHPDNPAWHTFGELCLDSDVVTLREMQEMQFDEFGNVRGNFLFLDVHKAPLRSADGKVIGVVGSGRDVTERKVAEESLSRERNLLRTLIDGLPGSVRIYIKDNECRYIVNNLSHLQSLGVAHQEDVVGKTSFDFFPHEAAQAFWDDEQEVFRTGKPLVDKEEIVFNKQLRENRWHSTTKVPLRDAEGRAVGLVGMSMDITVRKHLEMQLQQAQKMEAIGRLAGGIAHDFNNMIGVILGYANLIDMQVDPVDPLHKNVQAIITAAERSANLTKQLLAFARKQVILPVPLNLNDSIMQVRRMIERLVGEDLVVSFNLDQGLWTTKLDPTQVSQVLTNLASNARDAIENTGSIIIETKNISVRHTERNYSSEVQPGDYVMLIFSDSGKGMDQATQEHIFEPFFTTKPGAKGTGLGLATVFGIVKQNNGFIQVESAPGKGTSFRIYLPRCEGQVEAAIPQILDPPLRGTETILLVEDEEELLNLSRAALEMYGYKVLSASSPGDAIVLCERTNRTIDLMITDVVMPEMNGKELRDRLERERPDMKVIFMSGYTGDVVAHRGILDEGIFFLQKPFTPLVLARKVRDVLNG
jgi:two-component system, cell cycle sensor histidine kinase and response regulator CckA